MTGDGFADGDALDAGDAMCRPAPQWSRRHPFALRTRTAGDLRLLNEPSSFARRLRRLILIVPL